MDLKFITISSGVITATVDGQSYSTSPFNEAPMTIRKAEGTIKGATFMWPKKAKKPMMVGTVCVLYSKNMPSMWLVDDVLEMRPHKTSTKWMWANVSLVPLDVTSPFHASMIAEMVEKVNSDVSA